MSEDPHPSTLNGSECCYVVEARMRSGFDFGPLVTNVLDEVRRPFVLGETWRRVPFHLSPGGVPNRLYESHPATVGYQTYEAAMALAFWFLAVSDRSAIDVRLVRYRHDYTHTISRCGAGALIVHGFEADRLAQDWPLTELPAQEDAVSGRPEGSASTIRASGI